MEPGGFEPPSRDSRQVASTCVVDGLISAAGRTSTPSERPSPGIYLIRRRQGGAIGRACWSFALMSPQASGLKTRLRSGSQGDRREADPTSDCIIVGNYCCARCLTRPTCNLDTRPQTFPVRSIPVGPRLSKNLLYYTRRNRHPPAHCR